MAGNKVGALKARATAIGVSFEEYRTRIANGERWCGFHREFHPKEDFYTSSGRAFGVMSTCAIAARAEKYGVPMDARRVGRGHHRTR